MLEAIRIRLRKETCSEDAKKSLIEDMAYHCCPVNEIATVLRCTRTVIIDNYKDILNIAECHLRHDLRRIQVQCARDNKGNAKMLIWLGKQYLEQTELSQTEVTRDQLGLFFEWMVEKRKSYLPADSK